MAAVVLDWSSNNSGLSPNWARSLLPRNEEITVTTDKNVVTNSHLYKISNTGIERVAMLRPIDKLMPKLQGFVDWMQPVCEL